MRNVDEATVAGFGDEWSRFDQSSVSDEELRGAFDEYFAVFPWQELAPHAVGADFGCGSGRWARYVAPRVGHLHLVDASRAAIGVAKQKLADRSNVSFHVASVEEAPFAPGSLDFAYSLGVLHHIPDTRRALAACVRTLKPGAPFLVYLYYRFDNRPLWYAALWRGSELARHVVSRLPLQARYWASQAVAGAIYWPLARAARLVDRLGGPAQQMPLAYYRDRSFYAMRTDALDRLGTRLEQRFTRAEIADMLEDAGLEDVRFHEGAPYWCAVGRRAAT